MKYIVIKCGGSVLVNLPASFFVNIVKLHKTVDIQPVIVHGGGPIITSLLSKLGIETKFVNGVRVTTEKVLDLVEMVLSGTVNKQIVRKIIEAKGQAYGISGVDGMLLRAEQTRNSHQLGYVGEVVEVKKSIIDQIVDQGFIPVISPLGINEFGQRYNINGDVAASAIAKELGASLCMISDISGIYMEVNGQKITLKQVTKVKIEQMIQAGIIAGGMVPKVIAAIDGLVHGVPEVVIINGMEPDSLLTFSTGKEIGTKIVLEEESLHVY